MSDVLYSAVDSKPKRTRRLRRLDNISRVPRVSVLVDSYNDDWARLWWCRLDGTARVESEGSVFDAALTALAEKYPQYREELPAGPVVVIDVTIWSGWSAQTNEKGDS